MKAALTTILIVACTFVSGCGEKNATNPASAILQDSPEDVVRTLEACYRGQDLHGFSQLLAEDFHFYLEPGRRDNLDLPPAWDRESEVGGTETLFGFGDLADIRIDLRFGESTPVNELGREDWVSINVLDVFIEVDLNPTPEEIEGVTLRVDGDRQLLYFRKGRTPDDTNPATAEKYYLVEWRDFGAVQSPSPTPVERITWTGLKTLDY